MSNLSLLRANASLLLSFAPGAAQFTRALKNPETAQRAHLFSILQHNANCAYCQTHDLERVKSVKDFQEALPVVDYEDLRPWIERLLNGESNVLTSDPVLVIERTSGSASAAKSIPYTGGLFAEFQGALAPWLWNLYTSYPKLLKGTAYWQVTPLARAPERTRGGVPVGLGIEAAYFAPRQQQALASVLCVPPEIAVADLETSLYATLFFLLRDRNLSLISVWNPSFFSILLERAQEWRDSLVRDIHTGQIGVREWPPAISRKYAPLPERARRVDRCLAEAPVRLENLWPQLSIVSCWGDAEAAPGFDALARESPGVTFQKKGLLATEGVVTIPRADVGNVAAVRSHFLEFLDGHGKPYLVHELAPGNEYSVVMTTGGGLWRYRLGDRVRMTGFLHRTPLLEFVGKEDGVCDLRGEKLNPAFVGGVFQALRTESLMPGGFVMLAPSRQPNAQYVLFITGDAPASLATAMDAKLRANPQYAYARDLGQLSAPRVVVSGPNTHQRYLERCMLLGQRAGDVKPVSLHRAEGWEEWFRTFNEAATQQSRA
jgi:GH3 auxin-responsive promoter